MIEIKIIKKYSIMPILIDMLVEDYKATMQDDETIIFANKTLFANALKTILDFLNPAGGWRRYLTIKEINYDTSIG